ncbi:MULTISPECIES: hypothetical protein [Methylomonas]|uniref:Uncharacterized protein n=1 Tax=Methylomonas koyamae TaxID=702114 RepID=A0A177PC49_9GAMM|nr:hypothetical protein [Methylomonas koyamae]OAI27009.1 hypothetical protein A1355_01300 [Methylomonas koyamae]
MRKLLFAIVMGLVFQNVIAFESKIADSAVGCRDQAKLEKLLSYARSKDNEAFTKALLLGVSDGSCAMFQAGESVDVTDVKWSGLNQVRRRGDIQEYWVVREVLKR